MQFVPDDSCARHDDNEAKERPKRKCDTVADQSERQEERNRPGRVFENKRRVNGDSLGVLKLGYELEGVRVRSNQMSCRPILSEVLNRQDTRSHEGSDEKN